MTPPSLPLQPTPPGQHGRRALRLFIIWAASLALAYGMDQLQQVLRDHGRSSGAVSIVAFLSAFVCIAVTLYGFALIARWLLRKLFWRVGRRLFLSYFMIGVFPFFLFAILLIAILYMIAGVMSHAALRNERQATIGQLESVALEYASTGEKPGDALPTLEIYDTANASGEKLPAWLKTKTFSGLAWRGEKPLMLAARHFGQRTVVVVQPIDHHWAEQLEERDGMIIRVGREPDEKASKEERNRRRRIHVRSSDNKTDVDFEGAEINQYLWRAIKGMGSEVLWFDPATLVDWETGNTSSREMGTLILNPVRNLFHFYFGAGSDNYLRILTGIITGIAVLLLFVYLIAVLFAGVLIFSITRAVNRIEKGTKAVERGDFSYRIGMKPNNQLGEMARSFDRMTESIASLLVSVAENERLQSEIEIAATIQRNLLPKEGPSYRGVSFSAHFEPTASIGGDYYDVFNLDKTRLAVAIGDVSGHGLSTGLVMAMVKAAITTLVEEGADEVALFHRLNDLVYRSTERRAFMTLAFTIFDVEHRTIRHTNAGHLYPYLLRAGEAPTALEVPSLPLGVRADVTTRTVEVELQEGDAIIYLSDGIVEAQNNDGDPFGFEQLEELLAASSDRSPSVIRDAILHAVARHSGSRPADDDRTVMVLRFDSLKSAAVEAGEPALVETSTLS